MDLFALLSQIGPEAAMEFEEFKSKFAVKPTTFDGWMDALGFLPTSPIRATAALVDQLHTGPVTADHIAQLLGVDPSGILGGLVTMGDQIEAAIKAGQVAPPAPATAGTQPPAPSGSGAAGTSAGAAGGPHGQPLK